jgi:3',5'-cyclic AMP phosphodiesterase CpdA
VPSHGYLEPRQEERLVKELRDADPDKKLIVGLHHPPYSLDSHHGESEKMQEMLDKAFEASGRTPDLILSGHVHNYQRFARAMGDKQVPYIVSGNGGYYNKHKLAEDAVKGDEVKAGVTFEYGDDERYGFLKLTIKGGVGEGEYFAVEPGGTPDGSEMRMYRAEDKFTF